MSQKTLLLKVKGSYHRDEDHFFDNFPIGSLHLCCDYDKNFYRFEDKGGWLHDRFDVVDIPTEEVPIHESQAFLKEAEFMQEVKDLIYRYNNQMSVCAAVGILEDVKNQLLNRENHITIG